MGGKLLDHVDVTGERTELSRRGVARPAEQIERLQTGMPVQGDGNRAFPIIGDRGRARRRFR